MIIDSPIISGSYSASGSYNQFGNVTITGSLTVTGNITGNITGSATNAISASYSATATSASYAANATSASYAAAATSASYALSSTSASYSADATSASFAQSAISASNALTASYLSNYIPPFPFTGSAGISGSLVVNGNITAQTLIVQTITSSEDFVTGSTHFGSLVANTHQFTGSVTVSGSLAVNGSTAVLTNQTGAMSVATASYVANAVSASFTQTAISASYASAATSASYSNTSTSASYASEATSASLAQSAISASYALTASYASNVPATSSFAVSASVALNAISASYITGSNVIGTVASATSASYALTASYASNVPATSSFAVSASQAQNAVSAAYSAYALTSSYSLAGSGFPFSGSAVITGSLLVTNLSSSGVSYLVADSTGFVTAQTASAAIKSTQAVTSTAGQTSFNITNGYTTGLVDVYINGTKLSAVEYTDTSGTVITLATGSNNGDTVEFVKYFPASGVTNNALRQQTTITASAGQTVFSASYTPGLLDIYYNGARLSTSDYTANSGTYFTLATASAASDILDVLVYSYQVGAFSGIGGAGTASQVAYFDTTNSITGSPNFTISGSTMTVTGSLLVSGSGTFTNIGPAVFSGSITSTAGFTGSFSGTATSASYAANADLLDGLDSTVFTLTSSFAAQTASFTAFTSSINAFSASILAQTASLNAFSASVLAQTASLNSFSASVLTFTGSAATRLGALEAATASLYTATSSFNAFSASILSYTSSQNILNGTYATTGSNNFVGNQVVSGSLVVTGSITTPGTLTAQTLVVQTITSSVDFVTGSTHFGTISANTHEFTGSVGISGSLTSTGAAIFSGTISGTTIFGSTIACSPIGCFATSCATAFIGGTMSGTTIYGSTAVCSPVGKFTSCIDAGAATFACSVGINGGDFRYRPNGDVTNCSALVLKVATTGILSIAAEVIGVANADSNSLSFRVSNVASGRFDALTIASTGVACFSNTVCACNLDLSNTGRSTLRIFTGPADNEPGIELWSSYPSAAERNWRIGTSDLSMGDFVIKSSITCGSSPDSGCIRLQINNAGAATFACSVTAAAESEFKGTSVNTRILITASGVANTVIGFNNSGATTTGVINNAAYVGVLQAYPLIFTTSEVERFRIASTGAACFACELTAKTIGTNDLLLNNLNYECANYVDGTRGSWLIQEGACDLFIINQMSCKKYKFNLIEIK